MKQIDIDNPQGYSVCPSCCMMPEIQGVTTNCTDPEGCGLFVEDMIEINYDDNDEDEDLEELCFE